MADVFLSYARADAKKAARAAAAIRDCGHSVWFDESLPVHRDYSDVITEQLDRAKAVLVLWSADAVRSQWVRSEANRARETGRLVQARLDQAALPMPFEQVQCADLSRWRWQPGSPGWQSVLDAVAALAGTGTAAAVAPGRTQLSRRAMIIGGSAAAIGLAGLSWKFGRRDTALSPEAQLYLQKGMDELQSNDAFDLDNPASLDQAITLLSDATTAAPDSHVAWGALAMAYAARKKASPLAERAGLDVRSRSAASRALALDRTEPRALGALRMLDPVYRNWLQAERRDRDALKLQPTMPLLLFLLGDLLGSVGRWKEAAALARKLDRKRFLIAGADRKVVISLWSAGDLQGADEAMQIAVQHWPRNPYVWQTRLSYLTHSGRPSEAMALLRNDIERPAEIGPETLSTATATVAALAGQGDPAPAVAANLAHLRENPSAVFIAAHACAALGAAQPAFAILHGYYFGEGEWRTVAPPGGDEDRQTLPLFMPPMRTLWPDGRFDALVQRIGLTDYWRRSGTMPDFRRMT